ncbi:hypothetical protein EDF66_108281 [Sphingobacterium sp. JUb20]|nr:hypothetical protein [Sphingobacterium sp. JUb21]TCR03764.1 hypothetical protein EDF66_108281 [Sphingobacterium sp. JUb20]
MAKKSKPQRIQFVLLGGFRLVKIDYVLLYPTIGPIISLLEIPIQNYSNMVFHHN